MKNLSEMEVSAELRELQQRIGLLEQESEQKKSLLESVEKLSTLIAAAPDLLCFKDQDGRWLEASAFTLNLFGLSKSNYKGKTDSELMEVCEKHPNALETCISTDKLAWSAGKPIKVEEDIGTRDGYTCTFDVIKAPIYYLDGSPKGIVAMGRDVTERKENEKRLRLILENAPVMMLAIGENYEIVSWNKECERVTGFISEEIVNNREAFALIFPDEAYKKSIMSSFFAQGIGFRDWEITITCKDSTQKTISWFSILDKFPITGWKVWAFGVDITTRKQMEEALRQRQKEFRTLAENSPDVIIRLDRNLTYLYVSPSVTRYTKIKPSIFIGKSMGKIATNKAYLTTFQEWKREILAVIATGKPSTIESDMKLSWLKGEIVAYHARFIPEFSENGLVESVLCIVQDITEKKLLEKEFARLDKLNVIGEMAASIGHEVRNPMTTVRGFLQLLSKKPGCVQYADYFNIMIGELDRANSIISEFLALAKNKAINRELHNINEIIKSIMPLLEADGLMANKYITTNMGEIPELMVDHKEIRQLVLNLVRNGLEAMDAGGRITIKTYLNQNDVILAVEDEGHGIEPDFADKIGTPFFSTKEQGTGLGLAVCYSIANRHGASIKYETSTNGTVFFVIFQGRNGCWQRCSS
ncbi:MAG: signal transduction histidine kinase, nitrogen specific, NtrB [Sporomusa sp.]|jgi:PAS domain S-box-containing protein|nr:signal transduction histidine kinase, nitrogen specific, NtrB [Sporomusa sp.]